MKLITKYWQKILSLFSPERESEDRGTRNLGRRLFLAPVLTYRKVVSPYLKPRCIYYPSCSEYFVQAVARYGVFKGSAKGIYRILRCNPFASGGYDPLT
jgi:putative membrane protein insertion efficiency factor